MQTKVLIENEYSLEEKIKEIKNIWIQKKNKYLYLRFLYLIIASWFWFAEFWIVLILILNNFLIGAVSFYLFLCLTVAIKYFYKINLLYTFSFPFPLYFNYIDKKYSELRKWFFWTLKILKETLKLKIDIYRTSKKLEDIIRQDINTLWVNTNSLENLKSTFKELEKLIVLYDKKVNTLKTKKEEVCHSFKEKTRFLEIMDDIISNEEAFIVTIHQVNYTLTKSWIFNHQSELQELEKSIETQANETQNTDWKIALDLQSKRLQSYIESLQKITQ